MDFTKNEYLDKIKTGSEKATQKRSPKALHSAKVFLIIVLACTGIILAGGSIWTQTSLKSAYDNYNSGTGKVEFKTLNYEDTFTQWDSKSLGNDINLLLIGGMEYYGTNFHVSADFYSNSTSVVQGNASKRLDFIMSYVNYWNGLLYYRDDTDHSIYTYDMKNEKSSKLLECNAGEVLIADGKLYYVDLKNNNRLICTDLKGKEAQTVCDKPVMSFAVCGDTLLFEDTSLTLYLKEKDSSVTTKLCSGVNQYFLNENIIVESGDSIFSIAPDSGKAKKLNNSINGESHLAGAKQGSTYIYTSGNLYEVTKTKQTSIADIIDEPKPVYVYQGFNGKLYGLSYDYNNAYGMIARIKVIDIKEKS